MPLRETLKNEDVSFCTYITHMGDIVYFPQKETIDAVNNGLLEIFPLLFEGGEARLEPIQKKGT
ncbi:MAG: hypothetical protein ACUVQV_01010 [Dissulfurimicrobium sp.]|uniref:hypothetical protein n=1 Tax=Dissulfurimicrobium sp. TaxID=2022436 RepID=UPI00404A3265